VFSSLKEKDSWFKKKKEKKKKKKLEVSCSVKLVSHVKQCVNTLRDAAQTVMYPGMQMVMDTHPIPSFPGSHL